MFELVQPLNESGAYDLNGEFGIRRFDDIEEYQRPDIIEYARNHPHCRVLSLPDGWLPFISFDRDYNVVLDRLAYIFSVLVGESVPTKTIRDILDFEIPLTPSEIRTQEVLKDIADNIAAQIKW